MDLHFDFSEPPRVVVAVPNLSSRELIVLVLRSAGCDAVPAEDRAQALQAIKERETDLALVSVFMSGGIGLDLIRQIKTNEHTRTTPVIALYAAEKITQEIAALDAGADDVIAEPFNSMVLLTRARSLIRLKHLSSQLEHQNRILDQVLRQYVDRKIADVVLEQPDRYLKLGGETRRVTVMFADLRGFTRFTEKEPAEKVVDILNRVFTVLVEVIFQNGGTFDKFLGDAIMCFFGAPREQADHTLRALDTALQMMAAFQRLKEDPDYPELAQLNLGIGVHTGEAVVGNIGALGLMDFTVIGDTVNIARRLEEMAEGGQALISGAVRQVVPQAQARFQSEAILPGRQEAVDVYVLEGINL
jgi:class 3 adenylate cyclase